MSDAAAAPTAPSADVKPASEHMNIKVTDPDGHATFFKVAAARASRDLPADAPAPLAPARMPPRSPARAAPQVKKTTPLRKVMEAFCERKGYNPSHYRFIFDGERIQPDDTPEGLGERRARVRPCAAGLRPAPLSLSLTRALLPRARSLSWPAGMEDNDTIDAMVAQVGGALAL